MNTEASVFKMVCNSLENVPQVEEISMRPILQPRFGGKWLG